VHQAEATLAERRSALGKTVVRSPLDGRVGQRAVEPGTIVDAGTVLFEVGSLDELQVEIPLTGEMLGRVHAGSAVEIRADALAAPLRATLSRISPFLAETSFSTTGEIDVPNPDGRLRPGMFVNVDVLYGETEQATLVPASAVWEDPRTGTRGAYVVSLPANAAEPAAGEKASLSAETHAAAFRPLEVVAEGRDAIGVSGVKPGEWVVTVGQNLLQGEEKPQARVRTVRWDAVLRLQGLQREDLLHGFLERQQQIARARGAEPPSVAEFAGRPKAAAQGD
jgi:RND family efflux transporter MFP subunit